MYFSSFALNVALVAIDLVVNVCFAKMCQFIRKTKSLTCDMKGIGGELVTLGHFNLWLQVRF